MGRSQMVRSILVIMDGKGRSYEYKWHGRVTAKRIENRVIEIGKSFGPGGVNFHVSEALGYIPYPVYAEIRDNRTGAVLMTWRAPAFMMW